MPHRGLESIGNILELSDESETIKNPSDASGTIVKPSDASGTIVIDVQWDQDDLNYKNIRNGAIQCDLGRSRILEN